MLKLDGGGVVIRVVEQGTPGAEYKRRLSMAEHGLETYRRKLAEQVDRTQRLQERIELLEEKVREPRVTIETPASVYPVKRNAWFRFWRRWLLGES